MRERRLVHGENVRVNGLSEHYRMRETHCQALEARGEAGTCAVPIGKTYRVCRDEGQGKKRQPMLGDRKAVKKRSRGRTCP